MKKVCLGLGAAICVIILILTVSSWRNAKPEEPPAEPVNISEEPQDITEDRPQNIPQEEDAEEEPEEEAEPQTMDEDWSSYFGGLTGAAVIYDHAENRYAVYNGELAGTRRSPCSTFKIISSLIGLEQGIILPDDSVRTWSGEMFWNEDWNRDIGFEDAFRTSCVWYFREVIDEIGRETMQKELEKLAYGNCDISDWKGEQNTNNSNRALTGFWIESSLKISPKEQTEVMERIFGENSTYSEETIEILKEVMRLPEEYGTDIPVYGKTGMGKTDGITVDAWFTGFAETSEEPVYFCVYLGQSEERDVTSAAARDIAVQIISDYCENSR